MYFEHCYPVAPMLHRSRHLAALALPTTLQPAPCLQHIIMALGAAADPQFASLATPLYERARQLAEQDELKVRAEPKGIQLLSSNADTHP